MSVKTVLQFAIDNQESTRRIFVGHFGLRGDDVDDACQELLLRIIRAKPGESDYPKTYWWKVVRSVAMEYFAQRRRMPVTGSLEDDWMAGDRQDPAAAVEAWEEIAAALAQATEAEREALMRRLTRPRETASDRVRIHRFRRRLQAAMA